MIGNTVSKENTVGTISIVSIFYNVGISNKVVTTNQVDQVRISKAVGIITDDSIVIYVFMSHLLAANL